MWEFPVVGVHVDADLLPHIMAVHVDLNSILYLALIMKRGRLCSPRNNSIDF